VLSGFEEGFGEMLADMTSSLMNSLDILRYIRILDITYSHDGNSLDAVIEALRHVTGVFLSHDWLRNKWGFRILLSMQKLRG
jgi:hypothetical protein